MSLRSFFLCTTAFVAFASASHAADLIVEAPGAPDVGHATSPSFYVQLLGGVASGDLTFYDLQIPGLTNEYQMDLGYALAGTVGVVVMEGVSVEADVLHTSRTYTDSPDDTQDTTSLMANLKAEMSLNDVLGLYGAVGVGVIHSVNFAAADTVGYTGLGYQLIGGVSASLMENVSLIGEVRLQNSFGEMDADDPSHQYTIDGGPLVTAMAGLKISF